MRALGLMVLIVAGCKTTPAVDLTIVAGSAMSNDAVASIRRLDFTVGGVEQATKSYPIAQFPADRQERVVYQPRATSGAITVAVDAYDGAGVFVAHGDGGAALKNGVVAITIPLGGMMTSGDGFAGLPDLAVGPDFAAACVGAVDGTPCGIADLCHDAATCVAGVCTPHYIADGTNCGSASPCHPAPTCVAGVCTPHQDPNGAVCAPTSNPCQDPGVCNNGACGAISNKPNGTVCAAQSNPCRNDGTCSNGACGAITDKPTGISYDGIYNHRCCSGNPVDTYRDANNCGVCGWRCASGQSCISAHGAVYCSCGANTECQSQCCSTFYGAPYVCAAGNCSTNQPIPCPGNGINSAPPSGPYYCHY